MVGLVALQCQGPIYSTKKEEKGIFSSTVASLN